MWTASSSVNCAKLVNIFATIPGYRIFSRGLLFWRALYMFSHVMQFRGSITGKV